jgi:hypothetical protein
MDDVVSAALFESRSMPTATHFESAVLIDASTHTSSVSTVIVVLIINLELGLDNRLELVEVSLPNITRDKDKYPTRHGHT